MGEFKKNGLLYLMYKNVFALRHLCSVGVWDWIYLKKRGGGFTLMKPWPKYLLLLHPFPFFKNIFLFFYFILYIPSYIIMFTFSLSLSPLVRFVMVSLVFVKWNDNKKGLGLSMFTVTAVIWGHLH